ncbi:MAG TPA: prepilin peptidase [Gemmataceae bacterium]|jgi:leader peptidase (prepilin peptidase)/N-methyltransferase
MLVAVWTVFLLGMLFLLGSAVGSFLNVCIVRLPAGRSLIRPASCCGQCGKPIRISDNIPLLSYWQLRGRCRACGAPFSMRYFWIELLTGLVFVLIYWLEIGRNVHRFEMLAWYDGFSEFLMMGMFKPRPWLVFAVHVLLACFLIVAVMTIHEHHRVPRSVTGWGILLGLTASLFFPWPWPDEVHHAVTASGGNRLFLGRVSKPYEWGPRVGSMPADDPWWIGDVTPQAGLYPWPIWGPVPEALPAGNWRLGLATGLAGVLAGALLMGLVRLAFNVGSGAAAVGWGETSLLAVAGGFLGWQPVVVAGLLGMIPGLIAAVTQWWVRRRQRVAFAFWLALAVAAVGLGWYWIGPLVQGLFFNEKRLLLLFVACATVLLLLAICLRSIAARSTPRIP